MLETVMLAKRGNISINKEMGDEEKMMRKRVRPKGFKKGTTLFLRTMSKGKNIPPNCLL